MISSELPELLGIADRILVFFRGELRGELRRRGPRRGAVAHVPLRRAAGHRLEPAVPGPLRRRAHRPSSWSASTSSLTQDVFLTWSNFMNIVNRTPWSSSSRSA